MSFSTAAFSAPKRQPAPARARAMLRRKMFLPSQSQRPCATTLIDCVEPALHHPPVSGRLRFIAQLQRPRLVLEQVQPQAIMQTVDRRKPIILSWSGGKDSCLALYRLMNGGEFRVEALLTTITRDYQRISMHGVRIELLQSQAQMLGLPLHQVFISRDASNDEYESRMEEAFSDYRKSGIDTVGFGDLFLEEIRTYREAFLARHGMRGLYPVWNRDTAGTIREFIAGGFKTIIVCVDPKQLDPSFAGRVIDEQLLAGLPSGCDPCGENGEFHTFVFDGPIFRQPVRFTRGETVCRDSFCFCDLVPA